MRRRQGRLSDGSAKRKSARRQAAGRQAARWPPRLSSRSTRRVVSEERVDHCSRDDDAPTETQRWEFLRLHTLVRGGPRYPEDRGRLINVVGASSSSQLVVGRGTHDALSVIGEH